MFNTVITMCLAIVLSVLLLPLWYLQPFLTFRWFSY